MSKSNIFPSIHKMSRLARSFWYRLTEPPAYMIDIAMRYQSRLLAIFLLIMFLVFACVDLVLVSTIPGYRIPWYGYVFLWASFLLNHSGRYHFASWLTMGMFPIVVFSSVIFGMVSNPLVTLGYTVVGLILGSILLSIRGILIFGLVNVVGILLMPVVVPEEFPNFSVITGPLSTNLIALPLIFLAIHQRNRIENDRQAELRTATERLKLALSAAHMGTWDWNISTNDVMWSEHVESIFGLPKNRFDGTYASYLKLVFPEDLPMVQKTISDTLEGKTDDYIIEHRILWPDGNLNWLEARGRVYRDVNGKPIHMVGTVIRTTAQKQANEALKRYTKRLELLHDIDGALLAAESPKAIAEVAAENVRRLIDCQRVSVTLFDFQNRQVSFLAVSSTIPTLIPTGAAIPMEYYGLHIIEMNQRGEPYVIEDIWTDETAPEYEYRFTTDHIRAWLCMPLFYQMELMGSINIGAAQPQMFTDDQMEIAREVADQLAIALHHARLAKETEEALLREQRLNKVARAISSSLDLSIILPTIVQLTVELIDAEAGVMGLISTDDQVLTHPYFFNLPDQIGLDQPIPRGQGVAWRVIENKKGVLIKDYRQDPDALPQWIRAGLRGYIEVPLITGEVCLGVLGLYRLELERNFTLRDLALAESIGQQAGIAIQNARLFESAQRQLNELHVLHEVMLVSATATEENAVIEDAIQVINTHYPPHHLAVWMVDEKAGILRARYLHSRFANPAELTIPLGEGVMSQTVETGQSQRIGDVSKLPNYIAFGQNMLSELCVPLKSSQRVIGVLNVESREPNAFSEDDQRFLETLAGELMAAIERIRAEIAFHSSEIQRREMLEKVIVLGKSITQITDFQECLRQIHQSIQKGLGFDRVGLLLYDLQTDQIKGTYGTSKAGEIESNHWFMQFAKENRDWQMVLKEPRGIRVVENYQQLHNLPQESDMYGVGQHVTLAAWAGEKPVALIAVDNLISQNRITTEKIEALQLFAGYAGLAIENARWNTELEQRVVERTAQLEAANQELESFSYSVSHDLRAPLRAIDGFSSILSMAHSNQINTEGQRYIQLIRDNVSRMAQLINDLLAFSRLSRQSLHKQSANPTELAQQVVADLAPDLEGRQVNIQIGELPSCEADASLLRQVFVNLIGNAVKYSRLRETANIQVDWINEEGETVYFVRDNGIGFDMEYANKLFGVFQRLHNTEKFEGTGIGLAIVQRIIHRHGGRVWGEAEAGKGATFFFTLG